MIRTDDGDVILKFIMSICLNDSTFPSFFILFFPLHRPPPLHLMLPSLRRSFFLSILPLVISLPTPRPTSLLSSYLFCLPLSFPFLFYPSSFSSYSLIRFQSSGYSLRPLIALHVLLPFRPSHIDVVRFSDSPFLSPRPLFITDFWDYFFAPLHLLKFVLSSCLRSVLSFSFNYVMTLFSISKTL